MCRSIKPLRSLDGLAGEDEIREAALQFVRKVSGIRQPSPRNQDSFDRAVGEVARSVAALLVALPPSRAAAPVPRRPSPP